MQNATRRSGWSTARTSKAFSFLAAGLFAMGVQAICLSGADAAPTASNDTGFSLPVAGNPKYLDVAPTEITDDSQLNQPIGQRLADEIARKIGLKKSDTFSEEQYLAFIAGKGRDHSGDPASAKLVDQSVAILTNTVGHPLAYRDADGKVVTSVLASYGVFVTTDGVLESPAYYSAPTYLVNAVIQPGGYMGTWMKANGATDALKQLYASAYTSEAAFGNAAQENSKPAELITNTKGGVSSVVGMSMGPALWIVNFALIYTLKPELAANMPARWAPIPPAVVDLLNSGGGTVDYSTVASYFK